jgi:hypothetical protein
VRCHERFSFWNRRTPFVVRIAFLGRRETVCRETSSGFPGELRFVDTGLLLNAFAVDELSRFVFGYESSNRSRPSSMA